MTGDLFGSSRASRPRWHQAPPAEHHSARPGRPDLEIDRMVRVPGAQQYFSFPGGSLSRDDLYDRTGFHEYVRAHPDVDVYVILCTGPFRGACMLFEVPREQPARLDAQGRQDPAKQPFWRHGEVIHIQFRERAPP